jgi:outer membrane protein assembly factor BamB
MGDSTTSLPIGQQVSLPGHFNVSVVLEAARPLARGFECRLRLPDGTLEEAVISADEAQALAGTSPVADTRTPLANADQLRLLVESARIRLAYAHDRQFAVSLSGIRTLPHQIEAVSMKMLPQPRLRFLLADRSPQRGVPTNNTSNRKIIMAIALDSINMTLHMRNVSMIFFTMNLPPAHPPLTPPKRGTIHSALLPSLEGRGVGSWARIASFGSWILSRIGLATLLALSSPVTAEVQAADWPQWRGPNRDGVWNETGILKTFPADGLKIRWRTPVGPGWSSPVVVRGRVYLTDMRLDKPRAWERIQCFKESTGKLLWSRESELVSYPDWAFIPEHGGGPAATPIVEDGKIYSLGRNGQVDCWNARNGKVIWEIQLGAKYELRELQCRGSPLIEGNLLILFAGGKPGACVVALDKRTGKEVWKALDDSVSSSSPLIVVAGGKRQLIVWTDNAVTSLNPATGETYWREAMVTSGNDSIPTPVVQKNRLLISGLMFELDANRPAAKVLWPETLAPSKRLLSHTSTAMLQGDYVYSAKSSGELVCLEAGTGKQVWGTTNVTELKFGASIHLTPNGDATFLFTDEGNLILARLAPDGYHQISRVHLLKPTSDLMNRKLAWVPPVYVNRCVFARNDEELICASLAAKR